ncbi:TPA: hypothetical protein ACGIK9_003310 [Acinetobacter baumannii]|uniref:hypothetical protein n=1 Tax=Acinetobacter baumannii TaxID=470 RepID=UPI00338D92B4
MNKVLGAVLVLAVFIFFLFGSFNLFEGTLKVEILSGFQFFSLFYIFVASSVSLTAFTFYVIKLLTSKDKSQLFGGICILLAIAVNIIVINLIKF